ncbi:SnoaL-like domain-containing protein [Persephonella hydrogeniphila]|uniref:SnoaL-like domain-containing protein n=1 Tax=Persephonella hydrogeniphila TaxID=198703 RepID=A0A285N478_9AQUI|nr:nuclear transport factor 2 family protein [Persephonella hydrogeniphila]SNZ02541.1 SnoaL-like domain-containing protein [Persephonella hydrogeniphila]
MEDYYSFVKEWIISWNTREIEKIISHYSDEVEISSPMIKKVGFSENGLLKGKENVKNYWKSALKRFPDLYFELIDYTVGENCVTVFYISVADLLAMETLWFDSEGKIKKVNVCYRPI